MTALYLTVTFFTIWSFNEEPTFHLCTKSLSKQSHNYYQSI